MKVIRETPKTIFDTQTGVLYREGKERPLAPELIDLKVTNKCNANCDCCYMSSHSNGKHASYEWIVEQIYSLPERPLQIALGGGEPTLWPYLTDFVQICHALGIVVNTAVGPNPDLEVLQQISQPNYMSAIGISYINESKFNAILDVVAEGSAQIFVHCILRKDWLQKWIETANKWADVIDGIVFLLFKPCGRGQQKTNLIPSIEEVQKLLRVYNKSNKSIGFDSCCYTALSGIVEEKSIDTCDGGQYSLFLDGVEQTCGQCSFLPSLFNLKEINLNEAWIQMQRIKNCSYAL